MPAKLGYTALRDCKIPNGNCSGRCLRVQGPCIISMMERTSYGKNVRVALEFPNLSLLLVWRNHERSEGLPQRPCSFNNSSKIRYIF